MADIKQYAILLPELEGKLGNVTNTDGDMGGWTNCGVTLNTYIGYCKDKGLPIPTVDDLKKLDYPTWLDILKTEYWDKWQADFILNQSNANFLVDWHYSSGEWGIKIPQRILGLVEDGIVGSKTIAAVNAANQQNFHDQLRMQRTLYVNNIAIRNPVEQKFEKDWHTRINSFTYAP